MLSHVQLPSGQRFKLSKKMSKKMSFVMQYTIK